MSLKEFVENFVCRNSLIRLWKPIRGGHNMITKENEDEVCMDWELLLDKVWQSEYSKHKVVGVKDIAIVSGWYREAINIIIEG